MKEMLSSSVPKAWIAVSNSCLWRMPLDWDSINSVPLDSSLYPLTAGTDRECDRRVDLLLTALASHDRRLLSWEAVTSRARPSTHETEVPPGRSSSY